MANKHSFAVMAYKAAPFLEETVRLVLAGAGQSDVYLTTSTPSERIAGIAEAAGIPLHVNRGKAGIVGDWQFALSQAGTPYVTLADQDDHYLKGYAPAVLAAFERYPDAQIVFSNYEELDQEGQVRPVNATLRIKRLLLWPFWFKRSLKSRFARRLILRFGNPICSPAVTYNLRQLGGTQLFDDAYAMSLDWEAWLSMCDKPGRFVYLKEPLVRHRIHPSTQTSAGLKDGRRYQEDLKMYQRLWPMWLAKVLARCYAGSYRSNG